jgi:nucleoside-diphosphate-sugar epimerase
METGTQSPSTPAVLILGAAGRFGLAAVRAFSRQGWAVFAQVRSARELSTLPELAGVQWLPLALDDTDALAKAACDARTVVHALNPVYCNLTWCKESPAMLSHSIALARRLDARLMVPGNTYNFGPDLPEVLDEHTPQRATDAKGMVRIAMEQRLSDESRADGHGGALSGGAGLAGAPRDLRSVVIRAGDFFGSGSGAWFDQALAKDLWRGRFVYPGRVDIAHAWAYLPDLAQTFVRVAERDAELAAFEVLHFAGHTVTGEAWREALTGIARRLQWLGASESLKHSGVPWWLMRAAGPVRPAWRAMADVRHLWYRPHRIDNRRLLALLGSEPHTPFAQAVHAASAQLYPHVLGGQGVDRRLAQS